MKYGCNCEMIMLLWDQIYSGRGGLVRACMHACALSPVGKQKQKEKALAYKLNHELLSHENKPKMTYRC